MTSYKIFQASFKTSETLIIVNISIGTLNLYTSHAKNATVKTYEMSKIGLLLQLIYFTHFQKHQKKFQKLSQNFILNYILTKMVTADSNLSLCTNYT